jgi:hypothetical protein
MEFEVPERHVLRPILPPLTWSDGFCGGRGKRGALMEKDQRPMAEKSTASRPVGIV